MRNLLICAFLLPGSALLAQQPAPRLTAADVVAAERAFDAMAREAGVKPAFLEYLAPDGVVFRPGPVNGREAVSADPVSTALLTWRPAHADMSAAGDLGYSTGPYRVHPTPGAPPRGSGYYVTLWRRQPNGTLRAVLDFGLRTRAFADTTEVLRLWPGDAAPAPVLSAAALPALEARLSAGTDSLVAETVRTLAVGALHRWASERAVLFGSARPETRMVGSGAAASGDLAYGYGEYHWGSESGWYLHIWRTIAGQPRLVLELYSPNPS